MHHLVRESQTCRFQKTAAVMIRQYQRIAEIFCNWGKSPGKDEPPSNLYH